MGPEGDSFLSLFFILLLQFLQTVETDVVVLAGKSVKGQEGSP